MKVAVIADAHIGKGNDSKVLLDAADSFFTEVFFPYLEEHQIRHVWDLGDTFDRRKYVNINTLHRAQKFFIGPLVEAEIEYVHITGNHEVYHKYTNEVNTWDALFGDCPPEHFTMVNDGYALVEGIRMIPWICEDNWTSILPVLDAGGRALMAHLDLTGFEVESGDLRQEGMDRSIVGKFEKVLTGHFHKQSRQDNVHYVGSVGQYTWGDYGDRRGFHVLDTDTLETEFIRNPFEPFKKVYYDDEKMSRDELVAATQGLEGKYVKLVVKSKKDLAAFDEVVDAIQRSTNEINVVDAHMHADDVPDVDIAPSEDTLTILRRSAESAPPEVDRVRVSSILDNLYREAQGSDGQ